MVLLPEHDDTDAILSGLLGLVVMQVGMVMWRPEAMTFVQ